MREFIIGKDDADQRVDKFLTKTLKNLPKSLLYKYIRNKKIKVNRSRCDIAQRLVVGDTIQCYIAEEFFENEVREQFLQVSAEVDILYEDEHIVLLNKPSGMLVHSDTKEVQDNLADRFLHYLYLKQEYDPAHTQSFTPALCHRIDRNTEGIVIAAKTADALRKMNEKIKIREVKKHYLCICEGVFEQKQAHIVLWHKKEEGNKASLLSEEKEGYQKIETSYKVVQEKGAYSLIEVHLLTGKSHQIRAVMSYLQHPLYGDVKYGAHTNKRSDYQALCAYQVTFAFQGENGVLTSLKGKTITLEDNGVLRIFKGL